jgi:hypothetical protein
VGPAKKKKLITEVEPDLYEQMSEQAKKEDRSLAAMIRHALRTYLGSQGSTSR